MKVSNALNDRRPTSATFVISVMGSLLACSAADDVNLPGGPGSGGTAGTTVAAGGSGTPGSGGTVATAGSGGTPGAGSGGTSAVGGSTAGSPSMAGSGGDAGGAVGGSAGGPPDDPNGWGPTSCLPEFQEVCWPEVNFENEDPGGSENFDAVIQDVEGTVRDAACTVCSIMYRSADEVPRTHDVINFVIDDHNGVAFAGGNEIHLSTRHIQNYNNPDSALVEFRGVIVHEVAHLYQVNGGQSDGALIEGMADFVRIRVGLYAPGRRGNGGNWDGAYTTSGFFFSWLAGPCEYHDDSHPENDLDIGYRINELMSSGKDAIQEEIEETFGTDIDTLWDQYQDAI